jgi:hypothetical protein
MLTVVWHTGVPGWVTVYAPGARRDVRICVWAPKGVEVFLRPAMPTGPPPQVRKKAVCSSCCTA